MYIDIVPNRHSPPAILLRESFREGQKVHKRTVANLSQWEPARIEALRRALRGDFDHLTAADPVCGPVFGVLYALKMVADELGITAALGRSRLGQRGLFLTLARVAHQGSRLSAVRWAKDQAVAEVLGLGSFDEDDLYAALDDLAQRQERIEQALYRRYVQRCGQAPALFLYDVTSTYLEGEKNQLAEFGYNRDGKRGKLQIVVGLLTDAQGEPLAVRVFSGSTADPTTVPQQIEIVKQQFGVSEVVFVGDRGMVKSGGKQALTAARLRYITALTDPQIRKLLKQGTIQPSLFDHPVCEVEADGRRYILRRNEAEAGRQQRRLQDKLQKLEAKVRARNEQVQRSPRCRPAVGLGHLQEWVKRHKLARFVSVTLQGRTIQVQKDETAQQQATLLDGCYVIETDVPRELLDAQTVHDRYTDLAHVEQDLRMLKTGLLEIRPVFVRLEKRTRGHVLVCMLALKISRELQRRLAPAFGTTEADPHAVTLPDALAALGRLCLMTYPIDDTHSVTRLPQPDQHQARILQALNVHLPRQQKM